MTFKMDVDTGTIALQAAIKEDVELTRIIEDDLTQEGQVLVSRILLTAERNQMVLSSDNVELKEH